MASTEDPGEQAQGGLKRTASTPHSGGCGGERHTRHYVRCDQERQSRPIGA
jgi:hypothetical protein